ncbi:hypothetical protein [Thomasclavelia cocleata]|uniref:hypothetical protein n=1 Tax=Thomasclavelia cocleata TaxID=69824 RepID=UPI0024310734|nr:hypothetical protein [Thomasclavelia cocleata]
MVSEAKKKANAKSDKKNTVGKYLKLIKSTDADIISWLNSHQEPFNTYVKRLIREDIKKNK